MLHRRPLGNAGFHCRFSIAVYHHLSRYVIVCFCLFLYGRVFFSFRMRFFWFLTVCLHWLTFALVFLSVGGFAFVLLSVCLLLCVFAGLNRLLLGSEATVVFVVFHAVNQVVTNRWRIHRLWL